MSTPDKARETGQFFLAFCACSSKTVVTFEIDASVSRSILVVRSSAVVLFEIRLRCCMDVVDNDARIGQLKRHREAPHKRRQAVPSGSCRCLHPSSYGSRMPSNAPFHTSACGRSPEQDIR